MCSGRLYFKTNLEVFKIEDSFVAKLFSLEHCQSYLTFSPDFQERIRAVQVHMATKE